VAIQAQKHTLLAMHMTENLAIHISQYVLEKKIIKMYTGPGRCRTYFWL